MNKILVSDIIDLENDEYLLDIKGSKLIMNIHGKVIINLVHTNVNNLVINLKDNSELILYNFARLSDNLEVEINEFNNSTIYYNEAFINNDDKYLKINNTINGNDNKSYINIRNISNSNLSKIIINVKVLKGTIGNIAVEDLKGINNGGIINIEPNIIALSHEVEANHLTTIGSVNKNDITYLMSKGISRDVARKMLLKSFIYSNMSDYIKSVGGEDIA